jgi:hypothetical protein
MRYYAAPIKSDPLRCVIDKMARGSQPQRGVPALHRDVSDRHGHRPQAVSTVSAGAARLRTSGFELDHEITAKVLARGLTIVEVPVRYYPRSREEGKKIGWRDWVTGTRTFVRFRNG